MEMFPSLPVGSLIVPPYFDEFGPVAKQLQHVNVGEHEPSLA